MNLHLHNLTTPTILLTFGLLTSGTKSSSSLLDLTSITLASLETTLCPGNKIILTDIRAIQPKKKNTK